MMESWLIRITDYLLVQSWQIAVLTVLVAIVSFLLRNRSAHVRYLIWLLVLAKCLVPPLHSVPFAVLPQEQPITFVESSPIGERTFDASRIERDVVTEPAKSTSVQAPMEPPPKTIEGQSTYNIRVWLAIGWLVGAVALLFYNLLNALRTQIWLQRHRKALPVKFRHNVESFFSAHGMKHIPNVWLINGMNQPFVWGLVRGSIYLPADLLNFQDSKSWASLLGHELSHVIRFDAIVHTLQIFAQVVFWFHPFVWWANRRIRMEREKCCDEMAIVSLHALPEDYSEAIVEVLAVKYESIRPVPSLAVAGPVKNIEERIKTMLRPGKKFYKRPSIIAVTVVLLLALLTVPTALVLTARAEIKMEKPGAFAEGTPEENPDASELPESGKQLRCTGRVVNAKGEPIAGVRVRLLPYYDARLVKEMTTKADGAFYFAIDADRFKEIDPAVVVAEKEGLAIGWANWQTYNTLRNLYQQIEIKLGETKELTGVVVDEGSQPIVGAEVSICRLRIWEGWDYRFMDDLAQELLKVRTDRSGKFTFTNLPAEVTAELLVKKAGRATVDTRGYVDRCTYVDTFEFRPGQEDIKIEMPVEARIEGIVVEKGNSKPVAGVKLTIGKEGLWGSHNLVLGQEPVISREDGGFRISALTDGRYSLEVAQANDKTVDWVGEPVEVVLNQGESKSDVRIEVSKDAGQKAVVTDSTTKKSPVSLSKITGVVRDEVGQPVAGAPIHIFPTQAYGPHFSTDARGKFEAHWDPRVRNQMRRQVSCYLIVRDEERNLVAAEEIDENTKTLDIRLKPGVIFTGKVVDPEGKGVTSGWLTVKLQGFGVFPARLWGQTKTDEEGNFEIKAILANRRYRIDARADGYGRKRVEVDASDAVNNRLELDPVVLLPVANLSVSGVVMDAEDRVIAGASVVYNDQHTRTDAEGKFRVDRVCSGWVPVLEAFVIGKINLQGRIETEAGATDVKIVVTERGIYPVVGKPLKEIIIDWKEGNTGKLSDLAGKIVVLDVWATWCAPCIRALPELNSLAAEFSSDSDFVFVALSIDHNEAVWEKMVDESNWNAFKHGRLDRKKNSFVFNRPIPYSMIIDKNGVLCAKGNGLNIRLELDKLAKASDQPSAETPEHSTEN